MPVEMTSVRVPILMAYGLGSNINASIKQTTPTAYKTQQCRLGGFLFEIRHALIPPGTSAKEQPRKTSRSGSNIAIPS